MTVVSDCGSEAAMTAESVVHLCIRLKIIFPFNRFLIVLMVFSIYTDVIRG